MDHTLSKTILFLIVTVIACSCNKDNPVNTRQERSTIMNTSFEVNNLPSLEQWKGTDSVVSNYLSFSNDVPPNSGNWSLLFKVDSLQKHKIEYPLVLANYFSNDIYILSYWFKQIGNSSANISLLLFSKQYVLVSERTIQGVEPNWIFISDTLRGPTDYVSVIDSSHFNISVTKYSSDLPLDNKNDSGYCLIDNVKLLQISKQ